jgi:hypothetical protein
MRYQYLSCPWKTLCESHKAVGIAPKTGDTTLHGKLTSSVPVLEALPFLFTLTV